MVLRLLKFKAMFIAYNDPFKPFEEDIKTEQDEQSTTKTNHHNDGVP